VVARGKAFIGDVAGGAQGAVDVGRFFEGGPGGFILEQIGVNDAFQQGGELQLALQAGQGFLQAGAAAGVQAVEVVGRRVRVGLGEGQEEGPAAQGVDAVEQVL